MKKLDKLKWEKVVLEKDDYLPLRINHQIKMQLKEIADKENRTLSNLVETIIKSYLEKDKK